MIRQVATVAVYVEDQEKAKAFWRDKVGFKCETSSRWARSGAGSKSLPRAPSPAWCYIPRPPWTTGGNESPLFSLSQNPTLRESIGKLPSGRGPGGCSPSDKTFRGRVVGTKTSVLLRQALSSSSARTSKAPIRSSRSGELSSQRSRARWLGAPTRSSGTRTETSSSYGAS